MQTIATITSKRQLTIPSSIFKKAGLRQNLKVVVKEENGVVRIESATSLVEGLAGSIVVPARFKGKTTQKMARIAKKEYFSKKRA